MIHESTPDARHGHRHGDELTVERGIGHGGGGADDDDEKTVPAALASLRRLGGCLALTFSSTCTCTCPCTCTCTGACVYEVVLSTGIDTRVGEAYDM